MRSESETPQSDNPFSIPVASRMRRLPPYLFGKINKLKYEKRVAGIDVIDLGMGNPDGATPRVVVNKLIEASRNSRNHRYSQSRGIPHLREEIVKRYKRNYNVELDSDKEAIVTIGAKDALAHLLFAIIGPGDAVVSPNPAYPIHQYGVMMVNPQKNPSVKKELGQQFINWLVSSEGQKAIADYKINGQKLFYPNANEPGA